MAFLTTWNMTDLPSEMIDILEEDIKKFDNWQDKSKVMGNDEIAPKIRNSKNAWIPTEHWIGGWIWYYIQKANRENFLYDLYDIDGGNIQYTHYYPGDYYTWHIDGDISTTFKPEIKPGTGENLRDDQTFHKGECFRKLSFSSLANFKSTIALSHWARASSSSFLISSNDPCCKTILSTLLLAIRKLFEL